MNFNVNTFWWGENKPYKFKLIREKDEKQQGKEKKSKFDPK